MPNEELEPRVKQLESEVKIIGGQKPDDSSHIGTINKHIKSLKDTTNEINKSLTTAIQRLDVLTKELADTKKLLEDLKDAPAKLSEVIEAKTEQARIDAIDAAARLVVGLQEGPLFNLQGQIIRHEEGLIRHEEGLIQHAEGLLRHETGLVMHQEGLEELRAILMPEPAADRAQTLLPHYQAFSEDEMKDAVSKEKQDVLEEIAKLLRDDKRVLGRLFKSVTDTKLLARLFTAATARQPA